jgi:predicted metalloprotease
MHTFIITRMRSRSGVRWAGLALILGLVVGTTACGAQTAPVPVGPGPGPTQGAPQTPEIPDGTADDSELESDLEGAVVVVDNFWQRNWSTYFTGEYVSPTVAGAYVGTSGPSCAGTPSEPDNAFYCSDGDFLAWDANFMRAGFELDDTFVYMVLAHEWGHAIQERLAPELWVQERELQADCLAGAALAGAARDGDLRFEAGDAEGIEQTLLALGDDTPWTDPRDHGSPAERMEWFTAGASDGVPACLPSTA